MSIEVEPTRDGTGGTGLLAAATTAMKTAFCGDEGQRVKAPLRNKSMLPTKRVAESASDTWRTEPPLKVHVGLDDLIT